jgi:hypothetical protein
MTIRMLGLVSLKPINAFESNQTSAFKQMIKNTEKALGLTEDLDAVGDEDDDVDNDGDSDKSDDYLQNRRKVVSKAINTEAITRSQLKQIVKEEYLKVREEMDKCAKRIAKDLEEIRKECLSEMMKRTRQSGTNFSPAGEKRIHINTVAEMIDVPVNELMLYMLNNVKHTNERQLIEYRQGFITFYAN